MPVKSIALSLSRQRWLPYKTRRSVIKRLHPKMLKDFSFEADFFAPRTGLKFRGNIGNYIDRLVYFCGAYEKYMLCCMRDYARALRAGGADHLVFLDVGSNVGNHALFMSTLVDEVLAFEPYDRVRKQLKENLALNNVHNVQVFPFGLSDKDSVMPFYAAPDSNLGASSFFSDYKQDSYYLGDMELKHGDRVLEPLGVGGIAIVKADVEGFEKFVMQGLKETLARERPLVVMELSPKTRETLVNEAGLQALFPPRYKLYYFSRGNLNTGAYKLAPFDYRLTPKIHDIVACPQERLSCLIKR